MKLFFDFDDVLFNTKKFKKDYLKFFEKHGISKEIFDKHYYNPLDRGEIKHYDPVQHIRRISQDLGGVNNELEESIEKFVSNTSKYVFFDVADFLQKFNKKDLFMVSYSETDFQKLKILNSGVAKFFKLIAITNKTKGEAVRKIIKENEIDMESEEIFFMEDRILQIEDVKTKYPRIKSILCKRKEGRYMDRRNKFCDFECENLEEVEKIILK